VPALLTGLSQAFGDREAVVSRERRLTYRQLYDRTIDAAAALRRLGVTKGSRVGLLLGNSDDFVVAMFGALTLGAVVIPFNTMATPVERDYVLRHSDTSYLLTGRHVLGRPFLDELLEDAPALADGRPGQLAVPAYPQLRHVVVVDGGAAPVPSSMCHWSAVLDEIRHADPAVVLAAGASVAATDDALIVYTSGSTGTPKAVVHRQKTLVIQAHTWRTQLELGASDRVLPIFPFFWTAGLAMSLLGTLASGATLVLVEGSNAGEVLDLVERERVTALQAMANVEAKLVEQQAERERDLSSLRWLSRGSPLRHVVAGVPDVDPSAAFGLSETFTICTSLPSTAPPAIRHTTHGVPLPGVRLKIVDPATGETLRVGETGEIAVRGETLMRGYYKVDEADVFDDAGWFHTNDAGHLDEDGYLHWSGRMSNVIKSAGANVSPVEIENVLHLWGGLAMTAVVAVDHPTLDQAVVLCAQRLDGDDVSEAEVLDHLRPILARYKLPRRVVFVTADEVPHTDNDKVKVQALSRLAAARIAAGEDEWASYLRRRT
jgi:acyl-CoA synthetase (AMP-forming)/AMP-acid ligase II